MTFEEAKQTIIRKLNIRDVFMASCPTCKWNNGTFKWEDLVKSDMHFKCSRKRFGLCSAEFSVALTNDERQARRNTLNSLNRFALQYADGMNNLTLLFGKWEKYSSGSDMNADAKTLNALGRDKGFGSCLCCGDRWNWKKYTIIKIDEREGMFPLCEECFKKLPIEEIEKYIWRLADQWDGFHPEDAALHHEQASKAIVSAQKMKGGRNERV